MSRKHDQLDKSSKRKRGPSDNWAERYLGVTPRKHNRLRPFRWSAPSGDLSDSPSYHPSRTPVNPMSTENCTTVAVTAVVAALFVSRRGHYWGRPDIDAWDEKRDARGYTGNLPIVAHPPCASWCRVAGVREARYGLKRRLDGGCFASALQSLYHWGGVLEHPAFSDAWEEYGLPRPKFGEWNRVALLGTNRKARHVVWVTEVWQCDYGHRAQKRTWLLYVGKNAPAAMRWERSSYSAVITGCRNRCARGTDNHVRVWGAEASRTPPAFAEALIKLATLSELEVSK